MEGASWSTNVDQPISISDDLFQQSRLSQRGLLRQRDERGRDGAAQQRLAGLPLGRRVEGLEKLHLAAGEQRRPAARRGRARGCRSARRASGPG